MSRRSRRRRGFNHGQVLAQALAHRLGLPCRDGLLTRTGSAALQRTLDREDRFASAQISYAPGKQIKQAAGMRILLVDDVITTGATILACAKLLKTNGAKQISVAAICSTNE
jgi:predicted amidophosphoribosyltransferase